MAIVKLNDGNCYQVAQFDDTKQWFLEFKNTKQIDDLMEDLRRLKESMFKKKQLEYDKKHQLTLNFN